MQTTTDSSNLWRAESDLKLENARKLKSERTKDLGSPIAVPGKPLAVLVEKNFIWCAESTAVVQKIDLETGKTVQVYKGHSAPVTCLDLYSEVTNAGQPAQPTLLISGSWDKTIKIWNTKTKEIVSSTTAHGDFLKILLVVPELKLLVSSGADKRVKFWDFSNPWTDKSLRLIGSTSEHQRPVQCLAVDVHPDMSATLISADSMGIIKVWRIARHDDMRPGFSCRLTVDLPGHRTGINDLWYAHGELWTGSTDDTAMLQYYHPTDSDTPTGFPPPIQHPKAVKAILPLSHTELEEPYLITACGDLIRTYDISSPLEPELLSEVDAHWHDVTALRLWMRRSILDNGKTAVEPWVVSTSLDGTIRKWRLADLLNPPKDKPLEVIEQKAVMEKVRDQPQLTEEEERELAELMDSD